MTERDVAHAAPHKSGSDLLAVVPGVFVTQHSGQGKAHQIFLRGFDAQHGQDVEIWAGGAPVNEVSNLHGQGYADMHFIMPEVVQRVRALPGTYDVQQGDFAVAGSMFMDFGYEEPGFTGSTTIGSFFDRRIFLAYHPESFDEETFAAFEASHERLRAVAGRAPYQHHRLDARASRRRNHATEGRRVAWSLQHRALFHRA